MAARSMNTAALSGPLEGQNKPTTLTNNVFQEMVLLRMMWHQCSIIHRKGDRSEDARRN